MNYRITELFVFQKKLLICVGGKQKWFSEEENIFSSSQNKVLNVLITDNEIIGFAKLVEVVAISI